jgi:hypothetical protein
MSQIQKAEKIINLFECMQRYQSHRHWVKGGALAYDPCGEGIELRAAELEKMAGELLVAWSQAHTLNAPPRNLIPENILRAADAVIASPADYTGYPLVLAKWIRDSWPAISLPAAGDPV